MDSLPFADALIKEYLLFRGFTVTLDCFNSDLAQDQGCGYQAQSMTQLLFGHLIPELLLDRVLEFLELLNARLYVHLGSKYDVTIRKMEQAIIKCMLVTAVKKNRPDKVEEFFRHHGDELLQGPDGLEWRPWCALAFIQQPWRDPAFQAHFLPEWQQMLEVSFCNFVTEVSGRLPLPALLRFNADRRLRLALSRQVDTLQEEVRVLKAKLQGVEQAGPKAAGSGSLSHDDQAHVVQLAGVKASVGQLSAHEGFKLPAMPGMSSVELLEQDSLLPPVSSVHGDVRHMPDSHGASAAPTPMTPMLSSYTVLPAGADGNAVNTVWPQLAVTTGRLAEPSIELAHVPGSKYPHVSCQGGTTGAALMHSADLMEAGRQEHGRLL